MTPRYLCFSALSVEEIKEKLEQEENFSPAFGFIFSSVTLGIPSLAEGVASFNIPIFGASTAGEILSLNGEEPVYEHSAVCLFLDIDPTLLSVQLYERGDRDCFEFGKMIGQEGRKIFRQPGFIIAVSGLSNDGDAIVSGIRSSTPSKTPIIGGLAGDDSQFRDTYVFTHGGHTTNGAAVLILDLSRMEMQNVVTSGWTGVGAEMTVTSSEGNIVHSINGRPATRVLAEYLNVPDDQLIETAVTFPLLIRRPDGSEVLRTSLSADFSTGSITFAGTVPQGAGVRFSSSFGYETIEQSITDITAFHTMHPQADILVAFSCMARHWAVGSLVCDEIEAAQNLWRCPLIGFFTYGEIGCNQQGTVDFYNESLSLALLTFPPDDS